ncbi:MAG TPA: tetraacyldisaccharide 4'-kinase, partial [Tenuifilaceae bacterium]|nr:tetraacyldisaccharide 4'-kinase [Tenuifilaceae bacterium]
SEKEIQLIFEKCSNETLVVTTEKDAARIRCLNLSADLKQRLFYLSIKIKFLNNNAEKFNKQIIDYVGQN